jgi:ABC-2 type transport system permease protein
MAGLLILQIMFLFIGTCIAAVSRNPQVPASIATSILLLGYILSVVVDLNKNLAFLKYLTPFKYFDPKDMISGGGLDPLFVFLSIIIIAALLFVTYTAYQKRDMRI